jgi:hypothetical protein
VIILAMVYGKGEQAHLMEVQRKQIAATLRVDRRAVEGRGAMSDANDREGRATPGMKGQEIVEGLRELAEAMESGGPLGARFTVRTYKIAPPPEYVGEGVRRVRALLGMSQAAFAAFLGADASTRQ